jgi:hypothetical protein
MGDVVPKCVSLAGYREEDRWALGGVSQVEVG